MRLIPCLPPACISVQRVIPYPHPVPPLTYVCATSGAACRFIFGILLRPTIPALVVSVLKSGLQAVLASSLRPHLQHIVSAVSASQVQITLINSLIKYTVRSLHLLYRGDALWPASRPCR